MRPNWHLAARPLMFLYRWLLPVGAVLTLTGYLRPWISHKAAGLAILGLDLGELVKFLHPVQQGDIRLWREGFYLPLVAVSVSLSLNAFRREIAAHPAGSASVPGAGAVDESSRPTYGWHVRIGLLLLAIVAALNLLPPAWTPNLLLQPEYRLQTVALLLCLALAALSPWAALLMTPRSLLETLCGAALYANRRGCLGRAAWSIAIAGTLFTVALAGAALYFPLAQFLRILPTLAELYGQVPEIGWGPTLMILGLAGLFLHGLIDMSNLFGE